jgi:hypothetical protein
MNKKQKISTNRSGVVGVKRKITILVIASFSLLVLMPVLYFAIIKHKFTLGQEVAPPQFMALVDERDAAKEDVVGLLNSVEKEFSLTPIDKGASSDDACVQGVRGTVFFPVANDAGFWYRCSIKQTRIYKVSSDYASNVRQLHSWLGQQDWQGLTTPTYAKLSDYTVSSPDHLGIQKYQKDELTIQVFATKEQPLVNRIQINNDASKGSWPVLENARESRYINLNEIGPADEDGYLLAIAVSSDYLTLSNEE